MGTREIVHFIVQQAGACGCVELCCSEAQKISLPAPQLAYPLSDPNETEGAEAQMKAQEPAEAVAQAQVKAQETDVLQLREQCLD